MERASQPFSILLLVLVATSLCLPIIADHVAARDSDIIVQRATGANNLGTEYSPAIEPVSGPQHTLAVLVDFSDIKHTRDKSSIDAMIFGEMARYYEEVSCGRMQIVGRSVGWYALAHTMKYYGADTDPSRPGSDARAAELIRDAIDAVQDPFYLSNLTRIIIVHAGIGQEDSVAQTDLIWSEAYLSSLSIQTRSGSVVTAAAIVPEMESKGHSALGVYAHEFGHLLSLPDLYDINGNSTIPDPFIGRWSLMGTGLWLGNPRGSSPSELEAWSRIKLGWLTPDKVEPAPGNLSLQLEALQPIETSTGFRAIEIPTSTNVYYLVEVRKKISFDSYLPSEGILITRIDETRESGYGIVQVIDANPSTKTLNDSTYEAGELFRDLERRVFIDVVSNNSETFHILIGNLDPSSLVLTMTKLQALQTINLTYSQPVTVSAKLTDQYGNTLRGLPVRLQYYGLEQWIDLATGLTDDQGIASFKGTLPLKPGEYSLRLLFAGEKVGDRYLVASDQLLALNLRKVASTVEVAGPQVIQATQDNTLTVKVSDELGQPLDNVRVLVWVDNELIRNEIVSNGALTLTFSLGLDQVGSRTMKIEVEGDSFHSGATVARTLIVTAPAWLYALVAVLILVPVSLAYLRVRQRLVLRILRNP